MTARLYTTVYDPGDLPTEVAHIASKSLGTVNAWTELEYTHYRKGTGLFSGKINRHHSQAALLVAGRYVIVHSDAGPIGGAWIEEAPIDLSAEDGPGDEWMRWKGRGAIVILERGRLRDTHYSTDPAASPFRGNVDNEGVWEWINAVAANIYYGGVLARSVEEGQDEPGNPLAVVSMWGTDGADRRVNDASGTPWTGLAEAFRTDIGNHVLDLAMRFSQFGVITQMSYLFRLDAYNEANFGTDRSGAFGAATVRLEKGANIAASIQRKVRGEVARTHLIVGGADYTYVTVVHPSYVSGDPAHYGFLSVPETADETDLAAIGLAHLTARDSQTDAWVLPLKGHGDSPATGIYEPAPLIADGHFWVGDTISFHTGTGQYDANEQSAPVAAITWQLKTGSEANGDYWVIVEVGSTFHWEDGESFSGGAPGSQNNLRLCPFDAGQIAMDSTWKVLNTKGVTPPDGWNEVGFDDSGWGAAAILTGGSYVMDMGHESTDVQTPSDEILLRKEFYIEPEDVAGAAVAFRYAIDNAGVIYVNGTPIVTLGPDFTNTPSHFTGNHATTLARSTFRPGYNCVAIYVNNDAAGSLGAVPPGATSAGIEVEIDTTNGNGTSVYAARCDKHYHASDIDENNYGNVQAAIDALIAGDIGATDDATEGGRALHGRFVATYHRGSDQATYVLYSEDGLAWRNGAQINSFGRDPSLIHWDGTYWALITGGTDSFFLFTSPDLDTWTNEGEVLVDASATNCWAPEWIRNMDGTPYLHPSTGLPCFTVNVSTDSETTFTIREMHPTNRGMTAWSSPVTITGTSLPTKMIDGFLLVDDDDYWLWYKNEGTNKRIELATSSAALTSGYTVLESGDWAGWYANRNGSANSIEGPCLVRLPDGRWRIYFNENNGLTSIRAVYSETTDDWRTGTSTWTTQQPITTDALMAHGTVIYIPGMYDHQRDEGAHAVIVAALETQIAAIDPSVSVADVRDVGGHWEMLMQDGVSSPPVPLTTEDGTDWLYGWVSD